MLSLGKIAAGPQAGRYYTDPVARSRDDYYTGQGEAPGGWVGAGAAALRLHGEVDADRFAEILDGAGLRRPPREGAVAGFDLTFRPPKSVSVLWGIGDDAIAEQVVAGHEAALAEALGYLEREACRARRGAGGHIQVRGEGFVAAAFRHRASRTGDPLLHTHVVVGNLTRGPDGRWTALDARHLYRHGKTAGYLYQAVLRRELQARLGIRWGPVERGVADIDGISREVIEHFSTRRKQILEHMAERGAHSARAAQVAALDTRPRKDEAPADRMRELWRARAAEHGLDAHAIGRVLQHVHHDLPTFEPHTQQLTETASTFGRPELLQAVAEFQPAGARVADIERVAETMVRKPFLVRLEDSAGPGGAIEPRYTTRDLLAIEQRLLERAESRRQTKVAVASDGAFARAKVGRELGRDQEAMVRDLCRRGDGVAVVRAPAGAGKTYALDAAREAWEACGIDVRGCAMSARAALELHDQTAIEATTIARLQARGEREIPWRGVLVVDEAGMVGTRRIAELADACERAEAKLVLVGDDRQLPEIQAGGAFRALAERLGASELTETRRQRDAWDRDALAALHNGDVERWARAYRDHGRITIGDSARDTRAALINDWFRADGDKLIIAARRDDVRDLNDRARAVLQDAGKLARDELDVGGRAFALGDRVIGCRNCRHAGILNGQRGTVDEINRERESVRVTLDAGQSVELGADYLRAGNLDHGYAITAHRAQGATIDRAFVLGSEQLYREWGYTAISRHRDESRFYIARTDLGPEREPPPGFDHDVWQISWLMRRSEAKDLASDRLHALDHEELRQQRDVLHARLFGEPLPRHADRTDRDRIEELGETITAAERRVAELRENRSRLPWYRRDERALLDDRIARAEADCERLVERHGELEVRHHQEVRHEASWLAEHGPDAELFLGVDRELSVRERFDAEAARRVAELERPSMSPDPFERLRDRKPPHRDRPPARDIGMDFGP